MLEITVFYNGDVTVLSLIGSLETKEAVMLLKKKIFVRLKMGKKKFVIDLSRITSLTESGMKGLLSTCDAVPPHQATFLLSGLDETIRGIMKKIKFGPVFPMYDKTEEAVYCLKQAPC